MRALGWATLGCLAPALLGLAATSGRLEARTKPGPVTLRGLATGVHSSAFTLRTKSQGSYLVTMTGNTQVSEKGKKGRISVREGDHVGVRGFVQGRQIRAISVRIYPTKPKAYTVRGTVTRVQGSDLLVAAGSKTIHLRLTSGTRVRLGNLTGSTRDVKAGDRVQIRVQPGDHGLTAVSIHVYRQKVSKKHVEVQGAVTAVTAGAITVRSGSSSSTILVTGQTAVYVGATRTSAHSLKPGQTVTVRACCAGERLTATSIHVKRSRVTHSAIMLRGQIASIGHGQLRLVTGHGTLTVWLQSSTVYEVGSSRVGLGGMRTGDQVSVRAYRLGSKLEATRVHVYESYRRPHTIDGVVVALSRSGLQITARGKRYLVAVASRTSITLNGKTARLTSLRAGDKVRATGTLQRDTLAATRIDARRTVPKVKLTTVRGTVAQLSGSAIVIVDDFGVRHQVRLDRGVRIRLHGKTAPAGALFIGVRASARGHMSGGMLLASSLTLTVKTRTVKGRVASAARTRVNLRLSSGQTVTVDLPSGVVVGDGGRKLTPSSIHPGAYLQVGGYVESSGAVRAVSLQILHPALEFTATVVARTPSVLVQSSRGERFQLRFSASTQISTGREQLTLKPNDVPVGARLRVRGTVLTDGTLVVAAMIVRLKSQTLRGSVTDITGRTLSVKADSGVVRVRVSAGTLFTRASQRLTMADLVIGDDVTVYGYSAGPGAMFARKVLVHRARVGLDGTVSALSSDGFVLDAVDGKHRVVVSSSTAVTGASSTIEVGMTVHVSGYRRGDGVILATRVRVRKPHRAALSQNDGGGAAHQTRHFPNTGQPRPLPRPSADGQGSRIDVSATGALRQP